MSDLIDRKELYKKLAELDWQDLYLPVHFKDIVAELPTKNGYTKEDVTDSYQKGYENAVRHYARVIRRVWHTKDEKPEKAGTYLCTLFDMDGTFLALCERLCDKFDKSLARGTEDDDFCSHGERRGIRWRWSVKNICSKLSARSTTRNTRLKVG